MCSFLADITTHPGSSDDKGPILGWLNVLEAHHALKKPLPVNIRFCFEGMEESGSEGLDDFINAEAQKAGGWFEGVDCVCIVRITICITLTCGAELTQGCFTFFSIL
jgi:acetylornithine deacetylase/succinyl-diaminopimelate desuccinylase-like protein